MKSSSSKKSRHCRMGFLWLSLKSKSHSASAAQRILYKDIERLCRSDGCSQALVFPSSLPCEGRRLRDPRQFFY